MFLIDHYAYQNRLKSRPVQVKLGLYLLFLGISFSGIKLLQLIFIVFLIPITAYLARLPLKLYLKWLGRLSLFIGLSLITIMLTYCSQETELLIGLAFGKGYLGISNASLQQAAKSSLQIYGSLVSTYFLMLTVPFVQLLHYFRRLKLPDLLIELIVLIYRFIFLVCHDYSIIKETLELKGAFYHYRTRCQALARLANTLFLKIITEQEQMNQVLALKGQGFEGNEGE